MIDSFVMNRLWIIVVRELKSQVISENKTDKDVDDVVRYCKC